MTEQNGDPKKRVRIEVSTSTKGVHTYSATVEVTEPATIGYEDGRSLQGDVLAESDWLVAELDKRYPSPSP